MEKSSLRTGVISEKVLVSTFGTPKQIGIYEDNGRFISSNKYTILKSASRYAEIKDLGNKRYEVVSVYRYILPTNMAKMQTGIYKYIIPLMLNKIVNERDQYQKVNFTNIKWARAIEMINNNYSPMRYHKNDIVEKFDFDNKDVCEYFDKVDTQIQYYIQQTLKYLESTGLVKWYKVNVVCIADSNIDTDLKNGKINFNIDLKKDFRRATEEETEYILKCKRKAMKAAKINDKNENECYWGKKANVYLSEYSKLLLEKGILYSYDTYEAFCLDSDIDNLKFIMNQFEIGSSKNFLKEFNEEFKSNIVENSKKRYSKRSGIPIETLENTSYLECFSVLSNITIDRGAKKFKVSEDNSIEEHNIVDNSLTDKISVVVNGNKLKIN